MRTLLSLALLAALATFTSTPAAAQRHFSPRIDQLNSNDGPRLVQGDTKSKKKKKDGGQQGGGGQSGSGGGGAPGGGSY